MQAPYLIFCSEKDDLAPFQDISNFAQRLKDLGCDVKVVKWDTSPHVGKHMQSTLICEIILLDGPVPD